MGEALQINTTSDAAVLFAGLNADPLYDELEDAKVFSLVLDALHLLRLAVETAGGRVVKTVGDELMVIFPDAPQAAMAAMDMHRRFASQASAWPEGSRLTIGFSWGTVIIQDDGDVFGDTVSIAASANSGPVRKKPGTIVMDAAALQRLPASLRMTCHLIHAITRTNRPKLEFYELPWQVV